jgi:hypothetical protein
MAAEMAGDGDRRIVGKSWGNIGKNMDTWGNPWETLGFFSGKQYEHTRTTRRFIAGKIIELRVTISRHFPLVMNMVFETGVIKRD